MGSKLEVLDAGEGGGSLKGPHGGAGAMKVLEGPADD